MESAGKRRAWGAPAALIAAAVGVALTTLGTRFTRCPDPNTGEAVARITARANAPPEAAAGSASPPEPVPRSPPASDEAPIPPERADAASLRGSAAEARDRARAALATARAGLEKA